MKKIFYLFLAFLLITGCNMLGNTPTKRVEEFLGKYQNLDNTIINQIDTVVSDSNYTATQQDKYRDIIKKQYQDMTYTVKEEIVDGDNATVSVEIEVYDLDSAIDEATAYRSTDPDNLKDAQGVFQESLYTDYKLDLMKDTTERIKYTIDFTLNKTDGDWQLDDLTQTQKEKIHGIYNYD
jgi:hypothetical protein